MTVSLLECVKNFTPATKDLLLKKYDGQDVIVIGDVTGDSPTEITGAVFRVRASDGFEFDAFEYELN